MAVQIEILSLTPGQAMLALYYTADSPIAAANDQARMPAGTQLSAQEQQALKDGTLIEMVKGISINRLTKAQAKAFIEARWDALRDEALAEYRALYRDADLIGKAFNGTSWS